MGAETTQQAGTPPRFVALDGWRGVLAVCVAIYHTYWLSNLNSTAFFNQGVVLIDLFFVFSGFLMFTLYGGMRDGEQALVFLRRRFARIYPVHLAMLAVMIAYAGLRIVLHDVGLASLEPGETLPFQPGAEEGWRAVASHLSLTHSLGVHDSLTFNAPAWTVSVEMATYLAFAALMVWAPPRKASHFVALGAGVAALYALLAGLREDMNITYDLGLLRCLAGFGVGMLCGRVVPNVRKRCSQLSSMTMTAVEIATALAFWAFVVFLPGKGQFLVGVFACLFVVIFAQDRGAVSRLLGARPFRYLARVSYALYMVHFVVALGFGIFASHGLPRLLGPDWNAGGGAGDLLLVPYLVVSLMAAHLLHVWVERPGAALLRAPRRLGRTRALPQG